MCRLNRLPENFLTGAEKTGIFFTWGNQDVMELQRNMKFYGILDLLPGPVTYYDVQKLFSISYDDGTRRCALEHAIDELKIEKSQGFHRALADAWYTAEVLKKINNIIIVNHPSLDVYQNPKKKKKRYTFPIRIMTNTYPENSARESVL